MCIYIYTHIIDIYIERERVQNTYEAPKKPES